MGQIDLVAAVAGAVLLWLPERAVVVVANVGCCCCFCCQRRLSMKTKMPSPATKPFSRKAQWLSSPTKKMCPNQPPPSRVIWLSGTTTSRQGHLYLSTQAPAAAMDTKDHRKQSAAARFVFLCPISINAITNEGQCSSLSLFLAAMEKDD